MIEKRAKNIEKKSLVVKLTNQTSGSYFMQHAESAGKLCTRKLQF